MYVYLCENSIEGIFTGVYDAWASGYGHRNIRLSLDDSGSYELFCQYITVTPDEEKSRMVGRTLRRHFGQEVYQNICQAILSQDIRRNSRQQPDKADCVYRTILYGFAMPDSECHRLLQALNIPYIAHIFELSRATLNESHHLLGFLRFRELENGVLFSSIHPKNDVLAVLAEHFTDRLPEEHFMIYDENRRTAAIHKADRGYIIVDASDLDQELIHRLSPEEEEYRKLWCGFFRSIAIDARRNPKLQSQNIPKRFWADTVELVS